MASQELPQTTDETIDYLLTRFKTALDETLIRPIANNHDNYSQAERDELMRLFTKLATDSERIAQEYKDAAAANQPYAMSDGGFYSTDISAEVSADTSASTSVAAAVSVQLSSEGGFLRLREMFTALPETTVRQVFDRAGGDSQAAIDELLNIQFLKADDELPRGIDGFFKPEDAPSSTKRRKKRRKQNKAKSFVASLEESDDDETKERAKVEDVEFLMERFELPFDDAKALYKNNNSCRASAALDFLRTYEAQGIQSKDPEKKHVVRELFRKHPSISESLISTIVQVAGSIPTWPAEIAKLLAAKFPGKKLYADAAYASLVDDKEQENAEPFTTVQRNRTAAALPPLSPQGSGNIARPPLATASLQEASAMAETLAAKSADSAAYAAQLRRCGGADSLMRQAAHVWNEKSRDQAAATRLAGSAAADRIADQQSTATSVDLHGVGVEDGVRIALEMVQSWWNRLRQRRDSGRDDAARTETYTVITGLGKHSVGGVSRMRQRVQAELEKAGWNFTAQTGKFVVKGRKPTA